LHRGREKGEYADLAVRLSKTPERVFDQRKVRACPPIYIKQMKSKKVEFVLPESVSAGIGRDGMKVGVFFIASSISPKSFQAEKKSPLDIIRLRRWIRGGGCGWMPYYFWSPDTAARPTVISVDYAAALP
jgi:hypothetical protein